jgi:hypothetical protein
MYCSPTKFKNIENLERLFKKNNLVYNRENSRDKGDFMNDTGTGF